MKKLAIATIALIVAASAAMAGALNQFKAGDISFSLLDKDGATPLQSASIKVLDSASGDVVVEAISDDLGQAVLAIDAGRYLLNISDINLAVFDVDAAEGISLCRVIMPDAALLAGGQDDGENDEEGGAALGAAWIWPVIGGAAAVGLLVGAGFIIDNNTGGHHHHGGDKIVEPPTTYPSHKKHSSKNPSAT